MRIFEVESKVSNTMPQLFLDMDGVQADFFTQWARWHGAKKGVPLERYKEIGDKAAREESIAMLQAEGPEFVYKFFATLPVLDGFPELLRWIKTNKIPCVILSAPLRSPPTDKKKEITHASIAGKKDWLARHNPGLPEIFDGNKGQKKYANPHGTPNVLVDDHKKYMEAWAAAGGIPVLHRWMNTQATIDQLEEIYKPFLNKKNNGQIDQA